MITLSFTKIQVVFISIFLIIFSSCGCRDCEKCEEKGLDCECCPPIDSINKIFESSISGINIFLETSQSMQVYMPPSRNSTDFQKLIPDFIRRVNDEYINTKFYSIYSSSSPFESLPIDISRINISDGKFNWSGTTYIPNMFKAITDYLDSTHVNIFISDLIYSPENKNIKHTDQATGDIRKIFKPISKSNAISIYCINSKVTFKNNLINCPYYIVIQGKPENLYVVSKLLSNSFNSTKNSSFDEIHLGYHYQLPSCSVLPFTNNSGNSMAFSCNQVDESLISIQEIDLSISNFLEFWIGLDFNNYPNCYSNVEYLKNNLQIKIEGIEKNYSDILILDNFLSISHPDDILRAQNYSHFIKLKIDNLNDCVNVMTISLNYQRPLWVDDLNHDKSDSIDQLRTQTYGLNNIISGLEEVYVQNKEEFIFKDLKIILVKK